LSYGGALEMSVAELESGAKRPSGPVRVMTVLKGSIYYF